MATITKFYNDMLTRSSAVYDSEPSFYRYRLTRRWNESGCVNFLMLNPSTATEQDNDPTVERCQRRAFKLGYGAITVTNLFALRSTDPRALYESADPIGAENDRIIVDVAKNAQLVVCAWGRHGKLHGRDAEVIAMLNREKIKLHVLKLTQDGAPVHPLYLPYELQPVEWAG